tara:strand:+ start:107 stop:580 length:474 start_codon:yes stop_codon:yes gene_type:complete
MKKSVWLHNIRSVYNVGSIFRTADAVGIDHIYLSGYTPLPVDRFGRQRSDMHKIALGAEQSVSWSELKNIPGDIAQLQEQGSFLVLVEQDKHSVNYRNIPIPTDCPEIIIGMGEETKGFEQELLSYADVIAEIPMRGDKESLNVSVAFGIVAYQLFQ